MSHLPSSPRLLKKKKKKKRLIYPFAELLEISVNAGKLVWFIQMVTKVNKRRCALPRTRGSLSSPSLGVVAKQHISILRILVAKGSQSWTESNALLIEGRSSCLVSGQGLGREEVGPRCLALQLCAITHGTLGKSRPNAGHLSI